MKFFKDVPLEILNTNEKKYVVEQIYDRIALSTYMEIHSHGNTTITQNMVLLTYSTSYTVIHYTIAK